MGPSIRARTAFALAGVAVTSMLPLFLLPAPAAVSLAAGAHLVMLVIALTALLVTVHWGDPAIARARRQFAAALLAVVAGVVVSLGYLAVEGHVPVPSLADPVTLAWVPLAVVGFWSVPRGDGGPSGSIRLASDAFLATAALLFASWVTVLGPMLRDLHGDVAAGLVQLAYPLSDVFVSALVLAVLPRVRADLRPFLNCVAAGLLLFALGDSAETLRVARKGSATFGWPDLPILAGFVLVATAPFVRSTPVLNRRPSSWDRSLPQLAVVLACVVGAVQAAAGYEVHRSDRVLGLVVVVSLLMRQALHTRELTRLSQSLSVGTERDGLTGLPSRRAFLQRLGEHLSTPGTEPVAVLLLDIDGLKDINDTFGQEVGDSIICDVGEAAREVVAGHFFARMGGDEFAVLVSGEDPGSVAGALGVALSVPHQVVAEGSVVDMRCTSGVAVAEAGEQASSVLRRAGLALRAAKRTRVGLVAYTEDLGAASQRQHLLIAALGGAAERGEMRLVYQPVYRLTDGALVAAEALLRWEHPHFGAVPPEEFIGLAEDSNHIRDIGDWVLRQALQQLASWERQGARLPRVFVNVSADQFTPHLSGRVSALLAEHGLTSDRLVLELIESQALGVTANASVAELRADGVQLALDDFGSGFSSLAQLARLPADVVKLDRAFLASVGHTSGAAVMRTAVALAISLGMRTVAEGIEDEAQLDAARSAGVDLGQGYLLSPPLPPEGLVALLGQQSRVPAPRRAAIESRSG